MAGKRWLIISVFLLGMGCTAAAGQIIYVDADANGVNDGSSWADAYNYLQDALANALSGDEIWVAEGIYKPDQGIGITPGGRTATFQLKNGVAIRGGYAGFGEPDPNTRDIDLYETVLSGDLNSNDIDVNDPCDLLNEPTRAENSYQVVTGSGIDETATLEGFTINGGNANDHPLTWHHMGGGMYCRNSGSLTVTNCTFRRNSALIGGGIGNWESSPTVSNCKFVGNAVSSEGGGMGNNYYSSPVLNKCTFSSNSAGGGGGMSNFRSSPVLTNCNFSSNSAAAGGGMSNIDSSPNVTNCRFTGNLAKDKGGGMLSTGESSARLTNCVFSGNLAADGGGIYNRLSSLTLTNCILWGNTPQEIYVDHLSMPVVTYSDVRGGYPGEGNIDADPCFVDPNNGDYHLKSQAGRWEPSSQSWVVDEVTSPCIDAGDPKSPIGYEPFPNGGVINMGAYGGVAEASKSYFGEPVCETIVAGDINGDCKVNFLDFSLMAFHWLERVNLEPVVYITEPEDGAVIDCVLDTMVIEADAASFQGVGDLPGGRFWSTATCVSADGSVVVGYSKSALDTDEAFRWENGVMTGLGALPGSTSSMAYAMSADGSVVVGASPVFIPFPMTGASADGSFVAGESYSTSGPEAFRWENGVMVDLGSLPGGKSWSYAHGVSGDGSVVVGYAHSSSGYEAFWWEDGEMVGLGDLPGGGFSSRAFAVSADGSVVVGFGSSDPPGAWETFRWENGVMVGLGDLPGGVFESIAFAVSADGSVVVGDGYSASGSEAFRWENGTMVGLGALPGGKPWSHAYGVSADGSVIVGTSVSSSEWPEAFIWDADNGMRSLNDVLRNECGLDLTGWALTKATGVSADGLTIVGVGVNPDGRGEGWVARLPELAPLIEAGVYVDPHTLNLQSKGKWITCYIGLPEEYNVADIDASSILLEQEIEAVWTWVDEEEQIAMAKFSRSEVQSILNVGQVELTITGQLTDGTVFEGRDIIRVIDKGGGKWRLKNERGRKQNPEEAGLYYGKRR